jgi:polyribonucleotide nucleotidyltransferase
MVEAGANQVPEEKLLEALEIAQREIVKLCEAQLELRAKAGKPKWLDPAVTERLEPQYGHRSSARIQRARPARGGCDRRGDRREGVGASLDGSTEDDVVKRAAGAHVAPRSREAALGAVERPVREQFENELRELTDAEQDSKELKSAKRSLLFDRIVESVELPFPVGRPRRRRAVVKDSLTKSYVKKACEAIYKDLVRKKIAVDKRRPDGRTDEIRPIDVEVSVMPRTHGSASSPAARRRSCRCSRSAPQKEGQRIDDLSLERDRRYMHHYNFPPYSVGETGRMRARSGATSVTAHSLSGRSRPSSRPPRTFPYTIRIVSETLESNGSSSMGSVCGSTSR